MKIHLNKSNLSLTGTLTKLITLMALVLPVLAVPSNKVEVVIAKAPAYPLIVMGTFGPIDRSGTVQVEVQVNKTGVVTLARAFTGHPILRGAAVSAARGWQFNPTEDGVSMRTVTLTFIFTIMPKDTSDENLMPIFTLPYQVEVRQRSRESSASLNQKLRKKRSR